MGVDFGFVQGIVCIFISAALSIGFLLYADEIFNAIIKGISCLWDRHLDKAKRRGEIKDLKLKEKTNKKSHEEGILKCKLALKKLELLEKGIDISSIN